MKPSPFSLRGEQQHRERLFVKLASAYAAGRYKTPATTASAEARDAATFAAEVLRQMPKRLKDAES